MNIRIFSLILASMVMCNSGNVISAAASDRPDPTTVCWYDEPAESWDEALPLGNGRLGAMVFGDPAKERVLLNEETIWTGGPYQPANPAGAKHLGQIQQLVFDRRWDRAHRAFGRHMMGYPVEQQKYQPLGNLWLEWPGHENATDYRRQLDLDAAIATVTYRVDGVQFTRRTFVSAVDQIIVVRLTASAPGKLTFTARLTGYRNTAHSNYGSETYRVDALSDDTLQLQGRTSTYLGIEGRVRFFAQARLLAEGGTAAHDYDSITITGADSVTILLPAATNFVNYNDVGGDEKKRVREVLDRAVAKPYKQIEADHLAAHHALFRRLAIDLGPATDAAELPTDERLARFVAGKADPQLAALYYQFGRYLLISSSRPGTKPANLQGIWNEQMNPKWDSKYTLNINLEMNYWQAEAANLAECVEPLIGMMREITAPGGHTAKVTYGARGWVLHQNTDIWWATAPMDGTSWGTFSTGGAWLCTHLWEHYLYNPDRDYLKTIYPVLKGASLFFTDTLIEYPGTKWMVTCPSTSPENTPARPGNVMLHDEINGLDIVPNICAGPTVDMQILRDLFDQTIAAGEILGVDEAFREQLATLRSRLAPHQIGKQGQLQEWLDDWDDAEQEHRHFSHLYGMYPSTQISVQRTPELAKAARKSVEMRGDFGTGFSMAWKMCLYARMGDGDRAHTIFRNCMDKQTRPNLFSTCFTTPQVEGTFGVGAGIAEMLVQSHLDEIHLLPALPDAWPTGSIAGLRARGGFEIDMRWNRGALSGVTIRSQSGRPCTVRYGDKTTKLSLAAGEAVTLNDKLERQ